MNHDSLMATKMSKRRFLRGMGACLALPTFTSVARNVNAAASAPGLASTANGTPLRTAFLFFPNGAIPDRWWPTRQGEDFAFGPTLAPLQSVKDHVHVLAGLDHKNAMSQGDGGGDHARGNSVFLTGVHLKKSASALRAGISIDQVLAKRVGHLTRLPSLEISCDNNRRAADCDSGYSCAYQYNVSWQTPQSPVPAESNPRLVFERLFGAGPHGMRAGQALRRMKERRSVLDFVMEDTRTLQQRLGGNDRVKLDQYLDAVRQIEGRIERSERFGPNVDPAMDTPSGVPISHKEYVDLMYEMLAMAFQTDSTRIGTFAVAHDGDNRSFSEIGVSEGHHDLSHHQNSPEKIEKVATIDRWYTERLATFLSRLQDLKDDDGTSLLHNTQIVYGSGNADGNRHTHENLPILLAGGGGGTLKGGRYIDFKAAPVTNLFLNMADRLGVSDVQAFGDSTGRLTGV